jgi:hypothetical protein
MGEERSGQRAGRGKPSTDYTGTEARRSVLAEKLGELARSMQGEKGVEHTLDRIPGRDPDASPGRRGRGERVAPTHAMIM